MWHSRRRISPVFISQPTLSWEYLPYHINVREEEALLHYNSGKCPYELRRLVYLDELFVKKVHTSLEFMLTRRKHYGIMDSQGTKLFHVEQMTDFCSHLCCEKFPINYKAFSEPDRKVVMTFTGFPGILGGGGEISTNLIKSHATSISLGDVIQENNFCNPLFIIVDTRGKIGYTIQGPDQGNCWGVAKNAEFNICQHDTTEDALVIGKIRRNVVVKFPSLGGNGSGSIPPQQSRCKFKWAVEFPRDLDPATKASILGGAFLLESQYYE